MKPPRTLARATQLLERFADVAGDLARIEEWRTGYIASVNAKADGEAAPLLAEKAGLLAALEPWWGEAGAGLVDGKRKSLQLGGCLIGMRTARASLAHGFASDEAAVETLLASRYGKRTTRVKVTLDRTATRKLLELGGKAATDLAAMGFRIEQDENFFIERVEPATVVTAA